MVSKSIYIATTLIAFIGGYFIADFKHESSPLLIATQNNPSHSQNNQTFELSSVLNDSTFDTSPTSSLSETKINQIKELLSNTPENKITDYLAQVFPKQDFENISNKHLFAERLLQELSSEPDLTQQLDGNVTVSTTREFPQQASQFNNIHRYQILFAHFDTLNKTPANSQIFIKWTHQNTNNTILFTPKYVSKQSAQNWVSTTPEKGWEAGNYLVQIYQMNDVLKPIAHTQYFIASVTE